MLNFGVITNGNNAGHIQSVAIYSRSSIQNINNSSLWISKNKYISKSNFTPTRYCQDLFICLRLKSTKISVIDRKT